MWDFLLSATVFGYGDIFSGLWILLHQETERLMADPAPGISAVPHEDNLRYFDVAIQGPEGSPFERKAL